MSDKEDDIFLASFKELKDDVRQLDTKFDIMHEILIRNTITLEEHEKRSTASEARLEVLEDNSTKIGGFFIYSGAILSTLATLAAIFHYLIEPMLKDK